MKNYFFHNNKKYKKAVTFSYDDGITEDRRLVEIFNKYGMKCTFNLNTGIQSEESKFDIEGLEIKRMNQDGLKELYKGHEIATHGLTHSGLYHLTDEELEYELLTDSKNIEKIYGKYPIGMAYAYGDCDERIASMVEKIGLKYGRTVISTHNFSLPKNPIMLEPTCHHNDELLFELADKFLNAEVDENSEPMLFYIWGHSYEFDVNDNWDRIEKLCEILSGKDDVFYGTNAECLF